MNTISEQEQLERFTKLVGAYIRYVREKGKAPGIANLHKQVLHLGIDANKASIIRNALQECVAYVEPSGKARLYRDNRPVKELMPVFMEFYAKFKASAKEKKTAVITEEPVVTEVPEEVLAEMPVIPIPDYSSLSDDELAAVGKAYMQEVERREVLRKKREHLQTILSIAEMSADDLITLIEECK